MSFQSSYARSNQDTVWLDWCSEYTTACSMRNDASLSWRAGWRWGNIPHLRMSLKSAVQGLSWWGTVHGRGGFGIASGPWCCGLFCWWSLRVIGGRLCRYLLVRIVRFIFLSPLVFQMMGHGAGGGVRNYYRTWIWVWRQIGCRVTWTLQLVC